MIQRDIGGLLGGGGSGFTSFYARVQGSALRRLDKFVITSYALLMVNVIVPAAVAAEIRRLPVPIQARIERLVARLGDWPNVSGVRHLTGNLAGKCRLRTGDYRLQFSVNETRRIVQETRLSAGKEVIVDKELRDYTVVLEKAGHRHGFYQE